MDEGVVEGGEDVGHAEHELAVPHLRPQRDLHLLLGLPLSLPRRHATSAMVGVTGMGFVWPGIALIMALSHILDIPSPDP